MRKFILTLDDLSYKITYGVMALSVVIFIAVWFMNRDEGTTAAALFFTALTPMLLIILIIAMYLLKPLSVNVDETAIVIDRKAMPVTIPFSAIKTIRKLDKEDMRYAVRTFGNGGLYGYTGYYYNRTMGSMLLYCTQRDNYILIEKSDNKKIIITPDDPDGLVQFIQLLHPLKTNA